mmetsp:Transcript_12710/g.51029  ORF Transcript_12710/g.51029 Transcript_12710/m.51029 type:complete len:86 (+) Transcript_12710:1520-1777(+)
MSPSRCVCIYGLTVLKSGVVQSIGYLKVTMLAHVYGCNSAARYKYYLAKSVDCTPLFKFGTFQRRQNSELRTRQLSMYCAKDEKN